MSAWPDRYAGKTPYHGDAAFTRETLKTLVKAHGMRFVVIAETNHDNAPELLAGGNILVLRVIDHGKIRLYPTILSWLSKFPAIRHVTVHSNFTYSGLQHFVALIPFLGLIKLTNRRVTLVAHNVVNSLDFLAHQLDITNAFVIKLLNAGTKLYNRLLGRVVDDLIVLDAEGQKIMSNYVKAEKIIYNPHWVKPRILPMSKRKAKAMLSIPGKTKVILCFGFISWYKGSDAFAKLFANTTKESSDYHLIFAGGKAPSLSGKPHYDAYYQEFSEFVAKQPNMTLTGFLPDNRIGLYFAASDMVVLPYRGLMGGSGALGWTIGYAKPFVLSTHMGVILKNPDVSNALITNKLSHYDVLFPPTASGVELILQRLDTPAYISKVMSLSKQLRLDRNIERITDALYTKVYQPYRTQITHIPSYALSQTAFS